MLAPRSRGGSSGRLVWGRCCAPAATAQPATMARLAPVTQERGLVNNYRLRSPLLGNIYSTFGRPATGLLANRAFVYVFG
jgi:hypothetical protein